MCVCVSFVRLAAAADRGIRLGLKKCLSMIVRVIVMESNKLRKSTVMVIAEIR